MAMSDGSRRLMELEHSGEEAGGHRRNTFILQSYTRRRRMAQYLAVALMLVLTAALALLLTVWLGGRSQQSPDSKLLQPETHSPVSSFQQQQERDDNKPSAMLTAPFGNSTVGDYLEWESKVGHAFCLGGFRYSGGTLVVPRTGTYRVFLQITYESNYSSKCDKQGTITNSVYVCQDSYEGKIPLLTSVDTVSCSLKPWRKSLYTAGLFYLEAQGRLHVESSHPNLIVKKEEQMFFGAELLSP